MMMNIISPIKMNDNPYQSPYPLTIPFPTPEVIITLHDSVANPDNVLCHIDIRWHLSKHIRNAIHHIVRNCRTVSICGYHPIKLIFKSLLTLTVLLFSSLHICNSAQTTALTLQ